MHRSSLLLPLASLCTAVVLPRQVTVTVTITQSVSTTQPPDYFQTTPEIFQGPTATGPEPFLAKTNPAPFFRSTSISYIVPAPLETQEPIIDNKQNANIFELLGNLSPHFSGPGFGIDELPLPAGSNISWLNMLHRHGARYPTEAIDVSTAITNATSSGQASFTGELSFLNTWTDKQGNNILSPWGRQELYDSGVLHNYLYGHLYDLDNSSKILVRTTTQDRMRKSAENWLAGFFGLGWADNATLEFIIDEDGYNNSLAGYNACPNNNNDRGNAGVDAENLWISIYTANATERFNALTAGNFNWTDSYVYEAQQLCAYETVTLGFSSFCDLFTYQEWLDFEQSIALDFAGTFGFQSPTGRAVGIGYVEEVLAKINHHLLTSATGQVNVTLDSNETTVPLYQALNLDFTHEVEIFAVLTAFGLTQFADYFSPTAYDPSRSVIVSHMTPFAARLDIEIIDAPHPVCANRTGIEGQYEEGDVTKYIHVLLNQRTIPLGKSLEACGQRSDGWCELETFLKTQQDAFELADFDYACYGDYDPPAFGDITNGAPLRST